MDKKDKEDAEYEVDVKQTVLANIPWAILACVLMWFLVQIISIIEIIPNEYNQLTFSIVAVFAVLRMIGMIDQPTVHYKYRTRIFRGVSSKE